MDDKREYSAGQILLGLIGLSGVKPFAPDDYAWHCVRSAAELSQRLRQRTDTSRRALLGLGSGRFTHHCSVSGPYVTLFKLRNERNSFEPRFRGEIRSNGSRSILVGTIGIDPLVRPFVTVWLGFVILFVVIAVGAKAPPIFEFGPSVMFLFGCTLVVTAVRQGRRKATELGKWIGEQIRQIDQS